MMFRDFLKRAKRAGGSRWERGVDSSSSKEGVAVLPPHFRNDAAAIKHAQMLTKLKVHQPRYIDWAANYDFPIWELFTGTGLGTFLSLLVAFNSNFIMEFYANMHAREPRAVKSYVLGMDIEITSDDLVRYLDLSDTGPVLWPVFQADTGFDWSEVDMTLRGGQGQPGHCVENKHFIPEAYLIQHILRHTVFPKSGDNQAVNMMLSLATFFCVRKQPFDVARAFLEEMWVGSSQVNSRRLRKLPYGHVITHILEKKYGEEIFSGFPPEQQMTCIKPKDVTKTMKCFPQLPRHEVDEDERAEADAAGVREEYEEMQQDSPPRAPRRHSASPHIGSSRRGFSFPADHPPFHHQAPAYNEHRDLYLPYLGGNLEAIYARQDTLLQGQERLYEGQEGLRRSVEGVQTSVDRLTKRIESWWNPPEPTGEDDPPSVWTQTPWGRWP